MRIVWHIGPHKTGTTSLQTALAERARAEGCGYFYPEPGPGPGHPELAWRMLGIYDRPAAPLAVLEEVAKAEAARLDTLVVSSEEFSTAILLDTGFSSFASVCERVECELVLTLTPIEERLVPELQEQVKHGEAFDFFDEEELRMLIATRPGLRPDFVARAVEGIRPAHVTVIFPSRDDPSRIFRAMSTVLGEEVPPSDPAVINPSLPYVHTVWMSELNRADPMPWQEARDVTEAAFEAAAGMRPAIRDVGYPPLPASVRQWAATAWRSQLALLAELESAGRLRRL